MPVLRAEAALTLLLLVNAKVWTGNPRQPEAEAIAIRGNRIEAIGSTAEILKRESSDARVLDLHGRRIVAGFNDAHVHFYSGGATPRANRILEIHSGSTQNGCRRAAGFLAATGITRTGHRRSCRRAS
jgi:predicted amidohydrolase YtcJ